MLKRTLNGRQRVVLVIGLGVALYFVGAWIMARGHSFGWVAYAPLSNTDIGPSVGLHPWVRLVVWLLLIVVWVVTSCVLFRSSSSTDRDEEG
jgi:heme/copper-type cytochrome/quinol oxidase subunit 1